MTMQKIPIHMLDKVTGGEAPAQSATEIGPGTSWLGRVWKLYQLKPWQSPR
jgi:hypothetical protein